MSEVLLCCPLPGPPPEYSGDCGSCKTHTWSSPGVGEVYFFTPYTNADLVSFEFIPLTNNGSSIVVELYYCFEGECKVWETWNLGTLTSATKRYTILNFGNNPVFNSFELRITTTGGSSGSFNICLDCEVPVVFMPFCTGFTYNAQLEACKCTGGTVTLYAEQYELIPNEFPLNLKGYGWFLDPELQNPAPCGDYMINESVIYRYNCNDSSNYVLDFCDNCEEVQCSALTKSVTYENTSFTKSNPYVRGVTIGTDRGVHFYSEQCVNIIVGPEEFLLGYLEINLSYTGTPDSVVATFSDPVAADGQVGKLSYGIGPQPISMFRYAQVDSLVKVDSNGTTVFVTLPQSRAVKVRIMTGYKINNLDRPNVTTRISWANCGTAITGFTFGLHTYSAWDSIVTPRLRTNLYTFGTASPMTWSVNDRVYSDRFLTQPAFPYFYGYSADSNNRIVIKVGEYYRREWGTTRYFRGSQLKFNFKFETVTEDYKKHDRFDANGEYRVKTCIDPVMDIGKITSITPYNQLLEPEVYYYLVGRHPTVEWASNDDYFFRTDFSDFFSKKTGKKVPLTGMEHALWKNSEALAAGVNKYILGFDDQATGDILQKRGRLVSKMIAWGAGVITAVVIGINFIYNPVGTIKSLAIFALEKILQNQGVQVPSGIGLLARSLNLQLGKVAKSGSGVKTNLQTPLGKLWHNIFHDKSALDKYGTLKVADKCKYGCSPAYNQKAPPRGLDAALTITLMAIDRLYSKGYTRTWREKCEEFYGRFTTEPYVFVNNSLFKLSGLTGVDAGYNCDGAYIYTVNNTGLVTTKKTAYKSEVKKRFLAPDKRIKVETILPDTPDSFFNRSLGMVTDFKKLIFLPYTSGRPCKYYGYPQNFDKGANFKGDTYSNTQKSTTYTLPSYMVGELNNALPITMTVPDDYFYSSISQQDADDKAIAYLSGYTAATINVDLAAESKPGVTDEQFVFSHRLQNGIYPSDVVVSYQNTANNGVLVGTKLYYDYDGVHSCLTGYYITPTSGQTYYKKFYQVNSGGTVEDIWTMYNPGDTTVTSQETSQVVPLDTQFSAFTSAWYMTGDDWEDTAYTAFYNKHNFNEIWGTTEFYNSPYVCRGFMDNDGDNLFYIYNSNLNIGDGYSVAPKKYYRDILNFNIFAYVTDYVIYINSTEICNGSGATSGTTGIMFTLTDLSGNSVSSVYGITFNAEISYNGVANTTHEITFDEDDSQYFLVLDPIYQGNISGVTITEYLTSNPFNTIYFTGGTFTSCGDCIIDGNAEIPEGTFTLDSQYGLQVDTMNVSYGQIPNFSFPFTGVTATTMVSSYISGTDFEVILTGNRTAGTNKRIVLYVNNVAQSCEVISSDPSYTAYYLQTPIYINITDDINITIEDFTSC